MSAVRQAGRVCLRCQETFSAPLHLAETYCPACFGEAYGLAGESDAILSGCFWKSSMWVCIASFMGAFFVELWALLR